jgi:acyl-CoA synthetase (AMP-forming)/AMP-acid ligase II/acyl carrier protein
MPERTILDRISDRCTQAPNSIAIRALGRRPLSYAGLCEQLSAGVSGLRAAGVRRNDRVAVVLPSGPEMATACLTVCSAASCAPLNPEYKAAEFAFFFETLEASFLIIEAGASTVASEVAREMGISILELSRRDALEAGRFEFAGSVEPAPPPVDSGEQYSGSDDIAIVLHTSGSTSEPKVVPLTQANLVASAENIARSLDLGASDCALNMLPLFHVGGLLDLLIAPLFRGGSVILATEMSSQTVVECCRAFAPTWYQGVPTMLLDLLQRAESDAATLDCARFRFVRSVSAPLPEAVRAEFERVFDAPVIEMYGMTETAGLIASNPLPPGERKPGSVGIAAGPEMIVIDEAGNPARTGRSGEVIVRGPGVMAGYQGKPDVNAAAFIGDWLRTGDEGYLDEDGYLFLTGRIKEIINRGGEKISPREIDELALAHPKVLEAACFALPHESLGEEVALAVVAKPIEELGAGDESELDERELIDHLSQSLAYFKVPRAVYFVDSLPKTASGKLRRFELAAELGERTASRRDVEWVAPTGSKAIAIAGIWERVLSVSPIGMHDNFFDLGGDSLKAATFSEVLESETGYTMQVASLYDAPTVAELEAQLEEAEGTAQSPLASGSKEIEMSGEVDHLGDIRKLLTGWQGKRFGPESVIVGQNTMGEGRPLYWCSNGGMEYASLSRQMAPDQPIYGMRSIRGFDWKSADAIVLVAKLYTDEILDLQPVGPYLLGGYCDGGKIAFEIARQLQARGREVSLLCLNEIFVPQPYEGRVALFCSARGTVGRRSPYQLFDRPEPGIRKYYHGEVSVHVSDWGHGGFYKDHVETFAGQLRREIEYAESPTKERGAARTLLPRIDAKLQVLAEEDCWVGIQARIQGHMKPGETVEVVALVENRSSVTWQASAQSGIVLRSRWRNRDAAILLDGCAELDAPLAPGDSVSIELEIRAPEEPGRWKLYLDLVDEGVSWFGYRSGRKFRIPVHVSEGKHLLRLWSFLRPGPLRSV